MGGVYERDRKLLELRSTKKELRMGPQRTLIRYGII
jgi:hypothetical protein